MADGATIEFGTLKYVVHVYQERGARVLGEMAPAIAEAMHHQVLEVFETEGFGQWEPLAESTKAGRRGSKRKRVKVQGPLRKGEKRKKRTVVTGNFKILQDTGNLVGSITPGWNDQFVEVFSNVPYARFHASHLPRHRLPLRDFLDFDLAAFEEDVADMLWDRLRRPIPTAA